MGVELAAAAVDGVAAAVGGDTFPVAGVEGEVEGEGRAVSRGDDLQGGVERRAFEEKASTMSCVRVMTVSQYRQ